jgi:hypothetical protein
VYAVLAFSAIQQPTKAGPRTIQPDYTKPASELFLDVGKSLLATSGPSALSVSGKSDAQQGKSHLPSWCLDLERYLFTRPRGIKTYEVHEAPIETSELTMDAKDISARTSTLRISSQNELFLQAHIWDTVAETAHSGLNDVRADLSGLTRWIELVSKLDLPFEQRREALWRTLIEDVTAKSPGTSWPHRLDHDDFKGWLIFVCISAALGHGENFQSNHRSTERYDRYYHEKTGRPQPLIERLLRQAKACFVALGIPCSAEDNRSLEDLEMYSSAHPEHHGLCDLASCRAMPYVYYVGRNDVSRRVLRTKGQNMLGTEPKLTVAGDKICFVDGASVPYILRPVEGERFELILLSLFCSSDSNSINSVRPLSHLFPSKCRIAAHLQRPECWALRDYNLLQRYRCLGCVPSWS